MSWKGGGGMIGERDGQLSPTSTIIHWMDVHYDWVVDVHYDWVVDEPQYMGWRRKFDHNLCHVDRYKLVAWIEPAHVGIFSFCLERCQICR